MPKPGDTTVTLPQDLLDLVDRLVEQHPGHVSRSDYVRTAVREKVEHDIELIADIERLRTGAREAQAKP